MFMKKSLYICRYEYVWIYLLIKLILISVRIGVCLHIFREKRECVCVSLERELVLFSFNAYQSVQLFGRVLTFLEPMD